MGEIAEMMLNGDVCEMCGEFFHDDESPGIPRYCSKQCAEDRGAEYINYSRPKNQISRSKYKKMHVRPDKFKRFLKFVSINSDVLAIKSEADNIYPVIFEE